MFLSDCARCGRRELFGPQRVDALVTTERGIEVHYRCRPCGETNVLRTGVVSTGADVAVALVQPAPDAA